jgi:hypothetical protein
VVLKKYGVAPAGAASHGRNIPRKTMGLETEICQCVEQSF